MVSPVSSELRNVLIFSYTLVLSLLHTNSDPPRPESAEAVANCHRASIIPRMLTGDHLGTATAIAQLVGIIGYDHPKEAVMTGPQFDALSEDQIDALSQLPRVVARCSPETKVRMVEALHRRKKLCVMTGDGVNDAPSLKRADGKFLMVMPAGHYNS
jgi:Na+-exporting ATPase